MNGNNFLKRIVITIITVITVIGFGFIFYILWDNGAFLPQWIEWKNKEFDEQTGEYFIVLKNKSVHVVYDDSIIWNSPSNVKVQDILSCDIDNDQEDELILLCWKKGRYGRHRPFWIEKDENKWSQHIFVYEYDHNEIKPKWMSSYIGQDVACIEENGKTAPFTRIWLTDLNGQVSSWVWDSWGFTKEDTDISFVAFGDLIAHEPIYRYGLQKDTSFKFLFENFKEIISERDVAIINQETPLTDNPAQYSDYPRFGTPVDVGQAIVEAGFDVVTCATNHALDRGIMGINITKDFFENNHITCLGIQSENEINEKPYEILTRNGVKFAMFNYTYGTNGISIPDVNPHMVHLLENEGKIRNDIEKARTEADFVIMFVHWGTENSEHIDEFQQKWTKIFLNSKVDVVIGTHPHVIQPYEVLTDENGHKMLVFYSLGNFISAQSEQACVKGGMASFKISLTKEGYQITEYTLQPLIIRWQEGGRYTVELQEDIDE